MNPHFPLPLELRRVDGVGHTGQPLYRLDQQFAWVHDGKTVTVPEGFKTDLASVPRGMSAKGYKKAAVIHDYLCHLVRRDGVLTYAEADRALYDAMIDDGASKWVATTYWAYVRARHAIVG